MKFTEYVGEFHTELLICLHLSLNRGGNDDPVVVVSGAGIIGVSHAVAQMVFVKGRRCEKVAAVPG